MSNNQNGWPEIFSADARASDPVLHDKASHISLNELIALDNFRSTIAIQTAMHQALLDLFTL